MDAPAGVKTSKDFPIPQTHEGLGAGRSGRAQAHRQAGASPKRAEVLVRIDAAAICATDLEVIYQGPPG